MTPGVLMVTGAFAPEISGGGIQARTMMQALGESVRFSVLTTSTTPGLRRREVIDGVSVTRIPIDVSNPLSKAAAAVAMVRYFLRHRREFDIVHLHGVSQKVVVLSRLARWFGKKVVITMHTAGQDDPEGVRRQGAAVYDAFISADRVIAISDGMAERYRAANLPEDRLRVVPNGLDTGRFAPPREAERLQRRAQLAPSLPVSVPWIAFVGFFSPEKGPQTLYEAWLRLLPMVGGEVALLFAGATESPYFEVDSRLAASIREDATRRGLGHLVYIAGEVTPIERVYQAADLFVMPSTREAFGMALIEAMATGLPVVASAIAGVTDRIVDHGRTGVLVAAGDSAGIAEAAARLLADRDGAAAMGAAARQDVVERFGLGVSRSRWLAVYEELMPAEAGHRR